MSTPRGLLTRIESCTDRMSRGITAFVLYGIMSLTVRFIWRTLVIIADTVGKEDWWVTLSREQNDLSRKEKVGG